MLSFVMSAVFVLMAIGLFFLPAGVFEGWEPRQRYMLGGVILLYGSFRFWRARKLWLRNKENDAALRNQIEKDEA